MEQNTPFIIAYKKEEEKKRDSKKSVLVMDLSEKGKELFESLRELRAELARRRSIPPYMVASDKTLRDLCVRMPFTKEELLKVPETPALPGVHSMSENQEHGMVQESLEVFEIPEALAAAVHCRSP